MHTLSVILFVAILISYINSLMFDPDNCYAPGTITEENQKNLGFCPCKYGYYGPTCFEIHDCVIGDIQQMKCEEKNYNNFDLLWRCKDSKKESVTICQCPDGFRGETCEYIVNNSISVYLSTIKQSRRFFEVIYTRSSLCSELVYRTIMSSLFWILDNLRYIIMFFIVFLILRMFRRAQRNRAARKKEIQNNNRVNARCEYLFSRNNEKTIGLINQNYEEKVEKTLMRPPVYTVEDETNSQKKDVEVVEYIVKKPCVHV